jgi:biofilm PGA synthesis N-glycosyltransferase PgaC
MIYILLLLIFLILAPYVFYPVLMVILNYLLSHKYPSGFDQTHSVTIIIPTYNEEKVIAERIKNLDTLLYPKERLQVIIVDSGSKDSTFEMAGASANLSSLDCIVLKQEERKGKANAVNFAIQHAKGEIIIVSDANALFEKNSVHEIVKPFKDKIRRAESIIYSITNFSGEFNAFRKSLGILLDEKSLAEDFDLSLQIIERGYKVVYVPEAVVYEPAVEHTYDLIKQKKRRAVGTIQVIFKHIGMFLNPKLSVFNILLFFHKVLRVFTPALALMILTLFYLVLHSLDYRYKYEALALAGAAIIVSIALIELIFKKALHRKLYYFFIVQYSYILAWFEFLTGRYKVTWEKTDSSRDLKNVIDRVK